MREQRGRERREKYLECSDECVCLCDNFFKQYSRQRSKKAREKWRLWNYFKKIWQWNSKQLAQGTFLWNQKGSEQDISRFEKLFPLAQAPPHSVWMAGYAEHSVALQRERTAACKTVQMNFRCTYQGLSSESLNHAVQKKKIMQHWHLNISEDELVKAIKHINTALTFAKRAISWIQNHPVMPPCTERRRQNRLLSLWCTGNRAVHAGITARTPKHEESYSRYF